MIGIYGYDLKVKKYWYKVMVDGVEVKSESNLTKRRITEIIERHSMIDWRRDYE